MKVNFEGEYALVVCPNPAVDIFAGIESFSIGGSNRMTKETRYPGGKGVHVAMALEELGIPVVLLGFWGSTTGSWIIKACQRYYPSMKIDGVHTEAWTRSCYTFKSNDQFDDTEILGVGPTIKSEEFEKFMLLYDSYLEHAKVVALCGSWPKGVPDNSYAQMVQLATTKDRPSFVDCTGIQLKNVLKEKPFLLHQNRQEILALTGFSAFTNAIDNISKTCQYAAITDGKKGLYLNHSKVQVHSVVSVEVVYSSIGSGDCLVAGTIAGFIKDLSLQEIANLGAACGAANCIHEDLGMLKQNDVNELLKKMQSQTNI